MPDSPRQQLSKAVSKATKASPTVQASPAASKASSPPKAGKVPSPAMMLAGEGVKVAKGPPRRRRP